MEISKEEGGASHESGREWVRSSWMERKCQRIKMCK